MRKFSLPTPFENNVAARLEELRKAFEVQATRIAQMQAELDLLPQARKRRRLLRAPLTQQPFHTGNGHRHEQH